MSNLAIPDRKFLYVYSTFWIILITVQAFIFKWMGLSWKESFYDSAISNSILSLIGIGISNQLRYYRPNSTRILHLFIATVLLSLLWTWLIRFILLNILDDTNYIHFLNKSLPVRFCISFLITGWISLLSWIWFTLEEKQANEKRKSAAEKLEKEAELFTLRQQLQPHFLFNSLNSITALIGSDPVGARRMTQQLSDFLRGTIKKEDSQQVSLSEELQHLKLYLEIEKVRFGHRLTTVIDADEEALSKKLPSLLLQPIVENAIKFGLYGTTDNITIHTHAEFKDQQLVLTVQNPYDKETNSSGKGTGFGLSSVRRRLYLLFGRQDLLETHTTDTLYITIIKIPQL